MIARRLATRARGQVKNKSIGVILRHDVENVGVAGEHLTVKKGYARNFLFTRDLAVYATPENARLFAEVASSVDPVARAQVRSRDRIRNRLSRLTLRMKRHLLDAAVPTSMHAPVSRIDIAKKLKLQAGIVVTPDDVLLDEPLLSTGGHIVPVRVGDVAVDLNVRIDKR